MDRRWTLLIAPVLALGLWGCDVEQTEEGELPDVDMNVEPGNMPEYDVDAPDVDIETEQRTIEVPTGIDVDSADDADTTSPAPMGENNP